MVSHERIVVGGGAAGVSTGLMGAGKGANLGMMERVEVTHEG